MSEKVVEDLRKMADSFDGNNAQTRIIVEQICDTLMLRLKPRDEDIAKLAANSVNESGSIKLSHGEKLFVGCVMAAVVGLLTWTVNTTNETAKRVAVIESKLSDVRDLTSDRYTRSEHDRYSAEVDKRISRLEAKHGLE